MSYLNTIDVGGLCPSHLLSDWQKLQKVRGTPESSPEIDAGIKLSRRVLTCCWTSVVSVLGAPLGEKSYLGSTSTLSRLVARRSRQKHRQKLREDIITASLEGLHKVSYYYFLLFICFLCFILSFIQKQILYIMFGIININCFRQQVWVIHWKCKQEAVQFLPYFLLRLVKYREVGCQLLMLYL